MPRKRAASIQLRESLSCGGSPVPLVLHQLSAHTEAEVDDHIIEQLGGWDCAARKVKHFSYIALAIITVHKDGDHSEAFFFVQGKELHRRLDQSALKDARVEVHVVNSDNPALGIQAALTPYGLSAPYHWVEEFNQQVGDWFGSYVKKRDGIRRRAAMRQIAVYFCEVAGARAVPDGFIRWTVNK